MLGKDGAHHKTYATIATQGRKERTMVDETLAQLETRIRHTSALNEAQKSELLQLLRALHAEIHALVPTHAEQAESITGFTQVSTHEAMRQHRNPQLVELALKGLMSSAETFETSHPQLVHIVNSISMLLANIGI
jgi:hypothetical protein